jgi:hypothetical protein
MKRILIIVAALLVCSLPPVLAQKGNKDNKPSVSIIAPANNATFNAPANITVGANATDPDGNGTITKVEFYANGTLIGTDTTRDNTPTTPPPPPYSIQWNNVAAGSYSLTAKATDNAQGKTTSSAVSVTVTPPPTESTYGQWSAPFTWPEVAIHLHVLPNGNVLSWADDMNEDYHTTGTRARGRTNAYVWDIGTSPNPHFEQINNESTNLFCSGHAFLPDGRLLIMGGHEGKDGFGSTDSNIFDYRVGTYGSWNRTSSMASGRWYPSAVSLANGEVLTVSGSDDSGTTTPDIPEVYQTDGRWRTLTGAQFRLPLYPFLHVAPNGKVFLAGPGQATYYLDTSGTGLWTFLANGTFSSRDYGTSVIYGDGKVLVIGGGDPPTKTAEVINLNAASPTWQSTGSMAYARRQLNATLLPDGKVLVTGGTSGSGSNNATGAVFAAEMWDQATGSWSTMASMQVPRLYHSTAVLLPDGRVLSAGGGRPAASGEDPLTEHRDAEIYSPPYLFTGVRPTITSAPTTSVGYNQTFFVGTPEATGVTKVTLIRLSSATHSVNMNQRINNLSFSQGSGGLNVTTPLNNNLCPPGHYMLFILNGNGVPSVAKIIQVG